jgi:hypothetical protein
MSRVEIPIRRRIFCATGDVCLWAEVELLLKDHSGNFIPDAFLSDTGTEITTYSAYRAKLLGLPLPQRPSPGAVHAQTGLACRSGLLRFRVVGLDPTEYFVPCLFLGDPDTPPDPRQAASLPRKLLQPFALLDRLRFTADKDPARGNMYGELVVEKRYFCGQFL